MITLTPRKDAEKTRSLYRNAAFGFEKAMFADALPFFLEWCGSDKRSCPDHTTSHIPDLFNEFSNLRIFPSRKEHYHDVFHFGASRTV